MIAGEEKFCAEYDRIVSTYRKVKASSDVPQDIAAAHEAAVIDLHKLGYSIGDAYQILSRPVHGMRMRGS